MITNDVKFWSFSAKLSTRGHKATFFEYIDNMPSYYILDIFCFNFFDEY